MYLFPNFLLFFLEVNRYVKEGTQLTVMGVVNRVNDGYVTIVPISVPISTGCVFRKLLLPMAVDGLIFKFSDDISLEEN